MRFLNVIIICAECFLCDVHSLQVLFICVFDLNFIQIFM